jgi:hypothetical protein
MVRQVSVQGEAEADLAARAFAWLTAAGDAFLGCRGHHNFPRLRPGKQRRGVSFSRNHDGSYQIRQACPDCGTVRVMTTLPGGELDPAARYSYDYPEGYRTPGLRITGRMALSELWRRAREAAE